MTTLQFIVQDSSGEQPLNVNLSRCFNLGFTMRDAEKMQRHLEECYKLGVKEVICERPPLVMPIGAWAVVTDGEVGVQRSRTSGEVEIVTLVDADGAIYVGVGSDQTDRTLEAIDVPWGKQVAPNVVAPVLWRWEEVEPHWDEIRMESVVVDNGTEVLYQEASVSEFWKPTDMLEGLRSKVAPIAGPLILFSGTVVTLEETLRFGQRWTIRMIDPVLNRSIEHSYTVTVLAEEVLDDGTDSGVARGTAMAG